MIRSAVPAISKVSEWVSGFGLLCIDIQNMLWPSHLTVNNLKKCTLNYLIPSKLFIFFIKLNSQFNTSKLFFIWWKFAAFWNSITFVKNDCFLIVWLTSVGNFYQEFKTKDHGITSVNWFDFTYIGIYRVFENCGAKNLRSDPLGQ